MLEMLPVDRNVGETMPETTIRATRKIGRCRSVDSRLVSESAGAAAFGVASSFESLVSRRIDHQTLFFFST